MNSQPIAAPSFHKAAAELEAECQRRYPRAHVFVVVEYWPKRGKWYVNMHMSGAAAGEGDTPEAAIADAWRNIRLKPTDDEVAQTLGIEVAA